MLDMLVGSINANFWYISFFDICLSGCVGFYFILYKGFSSRIIEGINSIFWKWLFNSHSIILICECANDWCIPGMEEDSENSWGIWC